MGQWSMQTVLLFIGLLWAVHGQQRGYETMQAAVKKPDSCSKMTHAQT